MAAVKVWLVIYPSITLFLYFFGAEMAALPLPLRTLILTIVLVSWMVYIGLPALDMLLHYFFKKQFGKL